MLEHFAADTKHDRIHAALERDGAAVLEGLLQPSRVDALAADLQPHLDAVKWCNTESLDKNEFFGMRTKRLHGLTARTKLFGELIVDETLVSLADRVLSPHARDIRVSTGELMAIGDEEQEQTLHRDADSWYYLPRPRPDVLFSANIALTDFRSDNGATVVVPGSHRWSPTRRPTPSEKVQAVMPRGSALLYSGEVLHGGGANRTQELRVGLYVGYVVSWLRPIENHVVTNGIDAIRAAPARAQTLLDCGGEGWTPIA
jgi:ectoine hydroxylase-related dioxygenase (phytanoyl-CoA dioxygenase family)